MYADEVNLPDEVRAGGIADVEVLLHNERATITPLNPDRCSTGIQPGVEMSVTIDPDWDDAYSTTVCLNGRGPLGQPSKQLIEHGFRVPEQPGTYRVDVTVVGTGSGDGGTATFDIAVTEPADGGPIRPDPDPPDGGGGGDGSKTPIDRLVDRLTFGTDSAAVPLVILVVILVALLYLTAI